MKAKSLPLKNNNKIASRLFSGVDFTALSKAIMGLFHTSSEKHGADCLLIAEHAKELLNQEGINAELVIGECAIRVDGNDGGAVISHMSNSAKSNSSGSELGFHAWIKINEVWNVDFTTYQIPLKMKALDAIDGRATPVSWSPEFIVFRSSDCSTFEGVQESFKSGVIHYSPGCPDKRKILDEHSNYSIDQEDHENLKTIYETVKSGGEFVVHGPLGSLTLTK